MMESSGCSGTARRAWVLLALIAPLFVSPPAAAVDLFSRQSESDVLLRDLRRLRGLQITVEVRFLTVADEFLEQVGVDFGGSVNGRVSRRSQPVDGAKLIIEAYQVRSDGSPSVRSMSKTGRETVATDSSGSFSIPLRRLVPSEVRKDIQAGKVDSLVVEVTGKNGKRVDHLHLRAETTNGGLIP